MRLARKLFLLTAMALAALAMSATTASATGSIEVHSEAENAHCNPCNIVAVGESQFTIASGIHISSCEDMLHAEVYEDGGGHITELINTPNHAGGACAALACNGIGEPAAETEWPLRLEEVAGEERIELRFCLDSPQNPNNFSIHCSAIGRVENLGNHDYVLSMTQACPLFTVSGEWEIQGSPIEIEHPGD